MSVNPFHSDPLVAARLAEFSAGRHEALRIEARAAVVDGIIASGNAHALVERFELASVRDLMLLLLDEAKSYARPPISGFFVGAVGLEAGSGNLILGGNVEFPGTHLGTTLHGEGFVATRAFSRGAELAVIAIGEAHPCAHCRQYLSEFAASGTLELIDPLGHTLTLAQLYPWPFDPDYLGETGAVAGRINWPQLTLESSPLTIPQTAELMAAGRRSHAPYSKCPGAVLLELADGRRISGSSVESVAFNPSVPPLQAALINLLATGGTYEDIRTVTLGTVLDGAVDYARSTAELLARIAPKASLTTLGWTT